MELYQGFDTFNGKTAKGIAVKDSAAPPILEGRSTLSINVATSMEQLQTELEIEGSMKVSYAAFSAEAKSKYVHKLNLTTNSVVVVIYVNKSSTTESIDPAIPETILASMKSKSGVTDFVKKYGDSWVSKISKGGEFYVTFTFYSETKEEKEIIENSLSASGVVAGVSVNASLAMKLSNVLNTSKIRYSINAALSGYNLSPPEFSTPDKYVSDLITFANSLWSLEPSKPVMLSYEVTPYDGLLPTGVDFGKVRQNRISFLGNPAKQGWGEMVGQLLLVMNTSNAIKHRYQFYNKYHDSELEIRLAQIKEDLDYLYKFIGEVDANPNEEYPFVTPTSLLFGVPKLMYSVLVPVAPSFLNGGGGGNYQDVNPSNIPQHVRLNSIKISHGNVVDMITLKYSTEFPANESTKIHGTPGGTVMNEFFLSSDEYITAIYGWMGNRLGHDTVAGLYVKTNKDHVYKTADDAEKSSTQKWDALPGDLLIGFTGSSGNNLDCLQPVVLRISPARWDEFSLKIVSEDLTKGISKNLKDIQTPTPSVIQTDAVLASPLDGHVVNIEPNGSIQSLGRIKSVLHVYNTGVPGNGQNTVYNITILNVLQENGQNIAPGHTDSYSPNNNAVFIQNLGPSKLQVLYLD